MNNLTQVTILWHFGVVFLDKKSCIPNMIEYVIIIFFEICRERFSTNKGK